MKPISHIDTIRVVNVLLFFILALSFLSRCLFVWSATLQFHAPNVILAFLTGLGFDLILWAYFAIPLLLFGFVPGRIQKRPGFRRLVQILFFLEVALLGFATLCEQFFIDEFHARYNFIAVDYLVYSNEVLRNIWQSYPIEWIIPVYLLLIYGLSRYLFRLAESSSLINPITHRLAYASLPTLILISSVFFVREDQFLGHLNESSQEIAKNTVYTLFSAYNNNEIPYRKFYATVDEDAAIQTTQRLLLGQSNGDSSPNRFVQSDTPKKALNVVVVLMESMSARFLGIFGEGSGLTPNLDRLAHQGLFFNRLYATGTRTVRGLEAITLSIPPTPGQSIVRRPESGGLFNIGTVFRSQGYATEFLYGGRALFDNMGGFFESNGFSVFDQTDLLANEKTFENAWGVCDEDLFALAIRRADQVVREKGSPFFQIVLTTSNHRPYSYPEGRIDIPSRSGRAGAIKYADFSIGRFIEDARQRPWFDDTIFIFVADHNASVAGGSKILPEDYHIPMIFYSPKHISPQVKSTLGSQIDLAPTLLGLLGFSYESKFFGHDLRKADFERAFLATYQDIALWQRDKLVVLSPNQKIKRVDLEKGKPVREEFLPKPTRDEEVINAIAFYQTASDWYIQRRLKEDSPLAHHTHESDKKRSSLSSR